MMPPSTRWSSTTVPSPASTTTGPSTAKRWSTTVACCSSCIRPTPTACSTAERSTRQPGEGSGVLRELAEGDDLVLVRLLRQAEDALADDVLLHLIGAAVDRRCLREQRHLGDEPQE